MLDINNLNVCSDYNFTLIYSTQANNHNDVISIKVQHAPVAKALTKIYNLARKNFNNVNSYANPKLAQEPLDYFFFQICTKYAFKAKIDA